jgi:hypothetical protein
MLELVLLDGSSRRFALEEGAELMVGTAAHCTVRLTALDVSRAHALVSCRQGKTLIIDLGSTNGTFANGKRVKEAELIAGDLLRFSSVLAQVMSPGGEQSADSRAAAVEVKRDPTPPAGADVRPRTSDAVPAVLNGNLDPLLSRWASSERSAQAALVEWLVASRGLRGAAVLEEVRGEVVVVVAQGEIGPVVDDPACAELVRDGGDAPPQGGIDVTLGNRRVLAMRAAGQPWLVLVPGPAMPDFGELVLAARLLAVARRLDGGAPPAKR